MSVISVTRKSISQTEKSVHHTKLESQVTGFSSTTKPAGDHPVGLKNRRKRLFKEQTSAGRQLKYYVISDRPAITGSNRCQGTIVGVSAHFPRI
jgi:hypothetical protein